MALVKIDLGSEGSVLLHNAITHDWVVSGCQVHNSEAQMFSFSAPREQLCQWQELIPGVYIRCGSQKRSAYSVQVRYPAHAKFTLAEYQ